MSELRAIWDDPNVSIVLRSTSTSPFGRKVRMALRALNLESKVVLEPADTLDPSDSLRLQNPLGKMPCLLIGGEAYFDSHVILEMLDAVVGGGHLLPVAGIERFRALTKAKLADGVIEASLLVTYESRFRESGAHSEHWLSHQREKIRRSLTAIERDWPDPSVPNLVSITLACALGYLDWRRPIDWRADYSGLREWLQTFSQTHSFWSETEGTST